MPLRTRIALGVVMPVLLAAPALRADSLTEQLATSVKESTVNLGFRYRFEAVDDDAFAKEAWASTLRSRLTVAPKPINGFGLLLEVDDVRHVGADNFNDSRNGVTDRPGVTDPEGTDLNQALLRYTGFAGTELVIGRQRMERANQRFVGGVGWRQNEQTFDSVSAAHKFGDHLSASYAWVSRVNRIQGPDNGTPPADLGSNTQLLDASYAFGPALTLAGYWYLMDFDNAAALSNETVGLRATGGTALPRDLKLSYAAEFARQGDYGDNLVNYSANYYLVEAGVAAGRIGVKAGYEVLGGDTTPGSAFRTPLATLHGFQGWADKFTTTPDAGVADLYVAVTGKALGADLMLRYHDFSADAGSA
ncbi:MAG: alginate export family protein, partial [Gammaproteobacteria bacterium]